EVSFHKVGVNCDGHESPLWHHSFFSPASGARCIPIAVMARCFTGQIPGGFDRRLGVFVILYFLLAIRAGFAADPISGGPLVLEPSHVVNSGQFEPGTNWQAVTFETQAKGRYLCFDALSSQDGGSYASI